jgi:hypothetical protein
MNFRGSHPETAQEWLETVLGLVQADLPTRFSGLGVIFYIPPLDLPVAPLVPTKQLPRLSTGNPEETATLLRALSDSATPTHDGFHLVDATSFAITHVCQFFAPPIPRTIPKSMPQHPVGARFMAALLGSLLPSVVMTAVFGREGAITFERGTPRKFDIG